VNADLELNILDIVTIVNYIFETIIPTEYQLWAGDLNSDGIINVLDIVTLVQIILPDYLSRGDIISADISIKYGNGRVKFSSTETVSGFQLGVGGDFEITNQFMPEGWELQYDENIILVYNFGGENLSSELLFEYEGDLSIESNIITDWHGNALNAKISIIPNDFSLAAAYPNPFNPTTTISFAIPSDSQVSISVYNLQGREVVSLANGSYDAGYHSVIWNADSHSSGVYFVKMVAGSYLNTQKLMLVK